MNSHLPVLKTYKLFIGGTFPRSESGRTFPAKDSKNNLLAHVSQASRKDLRDAVVAARKALDGWSKKSAFNRGQILYRIAEILESRSPEMNEELSRFVSPSAAQKEIDVCIERLVWYAGWADKFTALFGSVNPVSTSHFNFSVPEPTGVVCILAPDTPSLLGLISVLTPVIVTGNTAVTVASEKNPLVSILFSEILATSDVPPGMVNILTGFRQELISPMATHMDVNAIVDASGEAKTNQIVQENAACNVKRVAIRNLRPNDWFSEKGQDPYWMLDTLEIKTTWHPMGI